MDRIEYRVRIRGVAERLNRRRESGFERRRLPLNEFAKALRTGYPELNESITIAVDRFLVLQSRGEA